MVGMTGAFRVFGGNVGVNGDPVKYDGVKFLCGSG